MSKVARTVATAAAIVAVVASTVATGGTTLGLSAAAIKTIGTVATVASAVSAGAALAAQATMKKPKAIGAATQFTLDAQSTIPYAIGRTFCGGRIVHVDSYGGDSNPYRSFVIVFTGGGPVQEIETVLVDREPVTVTAGGAVAGYYSGFMWLNTQLGQAPTPNALAAPFPGLPGWSAAHRLSGYAAAIWTQKFDKKGKRYASGTPEFGVVGKWAKVYDPRLDSTYPGGSGPCRALQESSYVWSENGPLHALTWAIGRWQNGRRVLGIGIEIQDIDLPAFVDAANSFEANGWKVGGLLDAAADKWNNLKTILWAGAAEPIDLGGLLSVRFDAPKVAIGTITADDLADGEIVVPAMKSQRDRINGIIPRFRSEAHNWEIIPGTIVRGDTYLAEDGEERTRESEYYCCQSATQAAHLAAYEIAAGREIDGITIPMKPRGWAFKPGDAVTIDLPEANLGNQLAIVTHRAIDPATGIVTLALRTETPAKHPWALGRTTTAPPSASITASAAIDALMWSNRSGVPEEAYNAATTYDYGRVVVMPDGARFIHTGTAASTGIAPPDASRWTLLSPSTRPPYTAGSNLLPHCNPNISATHTFLTTGWDPDGIGGIFLGSFQEASFAREWTIDDLTTFSIAQANAMAGAVGFHDFYFKFRTESPGAGFVHDMGCEAGQIIEFSAYTGAHRCAVKLGLAFHNAAGVWLSDFASDANAEAAGGGTALDGYKRLVVRGTAPPQAATVRPFIRKGHTIAPYANSVAFITRPMAAIVPEGQADPTPWSPGMGGYMPAYRDGTPVQALKPAEAGADVTGDNTAAALQGAGAGAYANNLQDLDPAAMANLSSASATASAASADLIDIADGGKLTRDEKVKILIPRDAELDALWTQLDGLAGQFGETSARGAAQAARTDYINYRTGLYPGWNDASAKTAINRTVWRAKVGAYSAALDALARALTKIASERADVAEALRNAGTGAYANNLQQLDLPAAQKIVRIGTNGRVSDPLFYNAQAVLGPSDASNLTPNYTVNGSDVTINFPAHSRIVASVNGPRTLDYGGMSANWPFSTPWTAYIDDPNFAGDPAPVLGLTSNANDLFYPGRVRVAKGVTPSSAGTGGTATGGNTGGGSGGYTGGGGGGGFNIP